MQSHTVSYNDLKTQNVADFLLVTVTKIETEKLMELLCPLPQL